MRSKGRFLLIFGLYMSFLELMYFLKRIGKIAGWRNFELSEFYSKGVKGNVFEFIKVW